METQGLHVTGCWAWAQLTCTQWAQQTRTCLGNGPSGRGHSGVCDVLLLPTPCDLGVSLAPQ